MSTDLTASFLRIPNDIADFYDGMREYWSTRTLMQGYGEAAKDITELVEDATRNTNPLIQACAGSGLAVAKMLGAIPIGIDHWVIETAKSTVHHGWGAGFKTLIGTPIEGFVDGGKFVLNQIENWSQGNISSTTMGVADEVATTLGTAGLMFLGIKGVHSGGTGVFNAIKNIDFPNPSLAYATGQVMPAPIIFAGAVPGGPLTTGLIYMSSTKGSSGKEPKDNWQGTNAEIKTLVEEAKSDARALETLKLRAKIGDPVAYDALLQIADTDKFLKDQLFSQEFRKGYDAFLEKRLQMEIETVVNMTDSQERLGILAVKLFHGQIEAVEALLTLAKSGDQSASGFLTKGSMAHFLASAKIDVAAKQRLFQEFSQLPDQKSATMVFAKTALFEKLPFELGVQVLNWLIQESVTDPEIVKTLVDHLEPTVKNGDHVSDNTASIYASADYNPIYDLAKTDFTKIDGPYSRLLDFAHAKIIFNGNIPEHTTAPVILIEKLLKEGLSPEDLQFLRSEEKRKLN